MRWPFAFSLAAAVVAYAGAAPAFERQHHLGVDGGFTLLSADAAPDLNLSPGFGLHYTYGLTDAFNLVAEGSFSPHAWDAGTLADKKTPHTLPGAISSLGVGAVYVLDVLRWVPYGGALAGASTLTGGNLDRAIVLPELQLALGLDYAITRQWAVGGAYRQHLLVTRAGDYPSYSTFFLRAEYVWGW
jgi:hypothetical protein